MQTESTFMCTAAERVLIPLIYTELGDRIGRLVDTSGGVSRRVSEIRSCNSCSAMLQAA